jgi:hypothetical protein
MEQIQKIKEDPVKEETLEYVKQIVNPYEFVFSNITDYHSPVCKLQQDSNLFFELMEIFHVYNIKEILDYKKKIIQCHITSKKSNTSSVELLKMFRENKEDIIIQEEFDHNTILQIFGQEKYPSKIDFFVFECKEEYYRNTSFYIKSILFVLYLIVKHQSIHGISIIKLDNIYYKGIIDIVYILSSLFDKIYILKPYVSNIINNERYLVCIYFNNNTSLLHANFLTQLKGIIDIDMNTNTNTNIHSILEGHVPYYFITRIEETNIVIGQQQLEGLEQVINIMNNKNKDEKMEKLKKNHIQKCIQWCEKNNVPYHTIKEEGNLFIENRENIVNEDTNVEDYIRW